MKKTLTFLILALAPLGWTAEPATHTDAAVEAAAIVDWLNTASPEELDAVKGIGEALAGRIASGRPYEKPADVIAVKGIGSALASRLFLAALDSLDN
jgi:DNA uptake protein ComE-like DNA-binding protein